MISSVEISNFRGYRHVSLTGLPRFNFLVGPSGTGKTALLEALWIVNGASPEIYFRMRAMRGVGSGQMLIRQERPAYETFFADIFTELPAEGRGKFTSQSPVASINIFDSVTGPRSLTMSYGSQAELPLDVDFSRRGTLSYKPLVFTWKVGEVEFPCPLIFVNNQISVANPPELYPAIFLSSSFSIDASENAHRLSELRISRRSDEVLQAIQSVYPQIKGISSEVVGAQQMVYAEVEHVDKQLPIQVVSSGLNKYIGIILATFQYGGGVMLVDEIENGFYFADYPKVIAGLARFCVSNDVQLFASTHSGEMLEAIQKTMEPFESELAFLRTSRSGGTSQINFINGRASRAALQEGIELR